MAIFSHTKYVLHFKGPLDRVSKNINHFARDWISPHYVPITRECNIILPKLNRIGRNLLELKLQLLNHRINKIFFNYNNYYTKGPDLLTHS